METPFFPVSLKDLPSNIAIEELKEMEFSIGKVNVRSKFANHPGICAGYRVNTSGGSIAFFPDNEPYELLKLHLAERDHSSTEEARAFAKTERAKLVEFLYGCDVMIFDTQYTDQEYEDHIGWGHGSLSRTVSLALEANVGRLILFHHDPNHDDEAIDEMLERARLLVVESGMPLEVEAAREGAEIWLTAKTRAATKR
jgi:phosphoribosyl 1,2-cyclic phosphodiesterase